MAARRTSGTFGPLTPDAINYMMEHLIMETVSMLAAFAPRALKGHNKATPGRVRNVYTLADIRLQQFLVGRIRRFIPGIGVIAEEPNKGQPDFRRPCTMEGSRKLFITVDPIDGTKLLAAGIRRYVGCMVSICEELPNGNIVVLGAWIVNLHTSEVFSAPVGAKNIWHTYNGDTQSLLRVPRDMPFGEGRILTRLRTEEHPELMRKLLSSLPAQGGVGPFEAMVLHRGSIGLIMVEELVCGEVQVAIMEPYNQAVWDQAPFRVFLERAGFVYVEIAPNGEYFEPANRRLQTVKMQTKNFGLWIHRSRLDELNRWAMSVRAARMEMCTD